MRWIVLAVSMCAAYPFPDPEPPDPAAAKPRELNVTGLTISPKEVARPKAEKITSAKDLEEAVADKAAREKIAKQVNFAKEYLLLFRWAGSGGDKLAFELKKEDGREDAVFQLKPGLTRDYRRHVKLFAIPVKVGHKISP
jgi:hypothetical protein